MKQIQKFSLTRLLESASLEFHSSVIVILCMFQSVGDALGYLVDEYRNAIDAQQQAALKDMRLSNTRNIKELDRIRGAFLNRLFKYIKSFLLSPDSTEKHYAETIYDEISRFSGISSYEMNKQTGEIKKLLLVLQQPNLADMLQHLHLNHLIIQITDSSNAFENEMATRIENEAKKEKRNTAEQRKVTETVYRQVVLHINAIAVIASTEENDLCIDKLNALIDEYKRTLAHMRSGGSGNEKINGKESPDSQPEVTQDPS